MTPNPNPSPELKPCPFCGSAASIETEKRCHAIMCLNPDCGEVMTRWLMSADEAATAWNTRAPQTLPAPGEVEQRFWLIVHKPGNVPERKGSWPLSELPKIMREFIAARPDSYLHVVTVDHYGEPDVQHGPEALQMADGRSMGVGRKHNARTLAAHTQALATVAAANDEGMAEAFARGVEAAATIADNMVARLVAAMPTGSHSERHAREIAADIRLLSQGGGKE